MESKKMPEVKDSGKRYVNANGGQRDTSEGKPDFKYVPFRIIDFVNEWREARSLSLNIYLIVKLTEEIRNTEGKVETYSLELAIYSMLNIIGNEDIYFGLESFALFMERCAKKYNFLNWTLLTTDKDMERFKISLHRHAVKALYNRTDEFHREAVVFNAMCLLMNFEREEENE